MLRRRSSRGFTLSELMVVVAIIGILAALAVSVWRKGDTKQDVDRFSALVRGVVMQATKRATSTGAPFLMVLRPASAQYCQVNPDTSITSLVPPFSTTQVDCASLPATLEVGAVTQAPNDAMLAGSADAADIITPGASYSAASMTPLSSTKTFYFGPNGTVDSSFATVMSTGAAVRGGTIYVRRMTTDEAGFHRRIVMYGVSSRVRIVDNY